LVASDHNSASTRLPLSVHLIDCIQSFFFIGFYELVDEIVFADTSGVDDRLWGKDVLDIW
jgi:hypothetical protein